MLGILHTFNLTVDVIYLPYPILYRTSTINHILETLFRVTAVHKSSVWTRFGGLFITQFYQWKGFCGKMVGSNNECNKRKLLGVIDMSVISIVVMWFPQLYAYVQTHEITYIKYVSLFGYWLYVSKAVLKICAHRHIQETYYYKIRKKKLNWLKKRCDHVG